MEIRFQAKDDRRGDLGVMVGLGRLWRGVKSRVKDASQVLAGAAGWRMAVSLAGHASGWEGQICGKRVEIIELAELRCWRTPRWRCMEGGRVRVPEPQGLSAQV